MKLISNTRKIFFEYVFQQFIFLKGLPFHKKIESNFNVFKIHDILDGISIKRFFMYPQDVWYQGRVKLKIIIF